MCRSDTNLC